MVRLSNWRVSAQELSSHTCQYFLFSVFYLCPTRGKLKSIYFLKNVLHTINLTQENLILVFLSSALMFSFSFCLFQVEADLGYPGGKAKIIHKESDIIMAFAINKVSCGC